MTSQSNLHPNNEPRWADRGWYAVLEFGPSRSILFSQAEALARTLPEHQEIMDENGQVVYRNIFRENSMPEFLELYRLISSWQSCQVYVKGYPTEHQDGSENGFICYLAYLQGEFNYCRNQVVKETGGLPEYIGCQRSSVAIYPWGWKPWFHYARELRHERYLVIDTAKILDTVHTNLHTFQLCPLVNWERTRALIEALPREIDVTAEPHWHVRHARQIAPQSMPEYFAYMRKLLGKFLS